MNWMQSLYETYDNCQNSIGYSDQNNQRPLLPICHITTQAHIEILIDEDGNFRRGNVVTDKNDSTTIIPSTEASASRAGSKPENHPLCDKLQYVAGDFTVFGGEVTSGFSKNPHEPFNNYLKTLTSWCNSEFSHPKAKAVLRYVEKGTVIKDLRREEILKIGSDGKFQNKKDIKRDKNTKDIFSVINTQEDAFIRWIVEGNDNESRVWRDKTLWDCWIRFYLNQRKDEALCLVTGKHQVNTGNHPKYIRREGDGAKLISSNDTSGFTFRGRFLSDQQACGVGLEVSQKSHFALAWLISRQGYRRGDLAVVAWAISGVPIPQPTDDPITLLFGNAQIEESSTVNTAQEIGLQFRNRIAGYGKEIGRTDKVIVMAVDSATPGRLSITYYRELTGSDFLQRIDSWHESCAWLHAYREIEDQKTGKKKRIGFIGAPAPDDIAEVAYGSRIDDKLRKATVSRLLPCIVDGQTIPRDLVESIVRRASNRAGMEDWEWRKTLSIACSLYKKFKYGKENFGMPLDETRNSRDYLYGRLLAIADVMEERALYRGEQKRATNAARYMQQFSQRPFRTWRQIHDLLSPYILRLGGANYYKNLIAEVESLFNPDDFISNKPLTGEYLLGYYCQRQKLNEKNHKPSHDDGDVINDKQDNNSK